MKHILLLTPGFPQSDTDTTCIPPLQALVEELQDKYHGEISIQVVAFHYPFTTGSYEWKGIPCWTAGGRNRKLPLKIWTWIKAIQFILGLHKRQSIDIVHSFWLQECTFIGQLVSRITGARHIAHAMGCDVLPLNGYIKFIGRKNISLVANSPFSAEQLVKNFNWKPQSIIPFGIREVDFNKVSITGPRHIDILAVGSLTEIKNHKLFVELFFELRKLFPHLKGKIIGEGPLFQNLTEKINAGGLRNSIELTGKLERSDVLQTMSQSNILLHTSGFESAGYVFLEALYCGMKVVSFKTGFMPETENGFQCIDKDEMLSILVKLLSENLFHPVKELPKIADSASQIFSLYIKK